MISIDFVTLSDYIFRFKNYVEVSWSFSNLASSVLVKINQQQ